MKSEIYYDVLLSNYEDSESRQERLKRVVCYYNGWLGEHSQRRLVSMHDHKGELTAVWLPGTTDEDHKALEQAWGMQCEHEIKHFEYDGKW